MGALVVEQECSASVAKLWQIATDWERHGRFFPFTTMTVPDGAPAVGQRFEATTRLGPVRLRDPMVVTDWEPPGESGRCELRKVGTVLAGRTTLSVEPSAHGSRLRWSTDVGPANPLARRLLAPLARVTAAPLYRHVVRAIVREAEGA
jgi:hypothetical protein